MAIITTKNFSNPPSVRGIDYAGQPIPENGFYNGRPEHQNPERQTPQDALRNAIKPPVTRRKRRSWVMSPEQRAMAKERMRRYWDKKRGVVDTQSSVSAPDSPSVSTGDA